MSEDFFDLEFANNSDPRCPVILILDTSDSMGQKIPGEEKTALEELNSGLDILVSELNKDPLARRRVEVSIITYGTEVSDPTPFATVDDIILPTLTTSGITSTGKAVETAIEALRERKLEYRQNGIEYYRPFIFLLSDGLPTDSIDEATKMTKEGEDKKSFNFFSIGIEGADMDKMKQFTNRPPMKLKGLAFDELFQWLSASASSVSASNPGDGVKLPSPEGWGELEV